MSNGLKDTKQKSDQIYLVSMKEGFKDLQKRCSASQLSLLSQKNK